MTMYELALMVREMRKAQEHYVKTRKPADLDAVRWAQRKADRAVKEALDQCQTTAPLPFDAADAGEGGAR